MPAIEAAGTGDAGCCSQGRMCNEVLPSDETSLLIASMGVPGEDADSRQELGCLQDKENLMRSIAVQN